ncbi:MAG TPA: DNA repair protein RadA, partial [Candidatus Obscuribacterales bacterium]
RAKTRWVCQQCGFQASGFLGRCTDCGSWNSMAEERLNDESQNISVLGRAIPSAGAPRSKPLPLTAIESSESARMLTGLSGFDEVLGGGLVPGSVVLIAGDPGIGKSTLLLQVGRQIESEKQVLYIAGEESGHQVRLRAERLLAAGDNILVNSEQNVASIALTMMEVVPAVTIIDSIQSVFHPEVMSAPGSVSQVRESAQALIATAKEHNIATILVGHVTKEGAIAGPRVLEHMVDVVLQFEGDRARDLRILRGVKNRFGSTHEIAVFAMTDKGLKEVDNPSALLLGDRLASLGRRQAPAGTAVIAGGDGKRSLLLEVQALVSNSAFSNVRRVANGWDYNRLLQIIAVLEKKTGLYLSASDVYVNVVGGLEFSDPSGDLGISVAIATSLLDRSVDPGLLFLGEIGLTGEVRPVKSVTQRLKEAARLGFKRAVVPRGCLPLDTNVDGMEVLGVESLLEALMAAIPGLELSARGSIKSSGTSSGKSAVK